MNRNITAEDVTKLDALDHPDTFTIINKSCEALDAKIKKLYNESFKLHDQYRLLKSRYETESGFFNLISIQWKMNEIQNKLSNIHDQVAPLNENRLYKTYGID